MPNTDDSDRLYKLCSIVTHIGSGPNHGHYVSIAKSYDKWILFDDEEIQLLDERDLSSCYGATNEMLNHLRRSETGYLLFYQTDQLDDEFNGSSLRSNGFHNHKKTGKVVQV